MKLKTRMTELNEQQIFEAINQISTASAVASLTIAKHTNMNKANAMLIGVGSSLLVAGLIKYLEE
ncbi:hypothetical protein [Bizionia paragorgiae]|jgi:fructoselysine-6-P-deglycase FrlB-like protein|uniref:Uncharacterized protein n=1 Tax=Bizionia paragorgiae TaxID=283786 RepID=A0A1H4D5M3_BIZPA|nr:hypothetical protein [Bizionia paragorgiae]SEA67897.1 hypothetical protein SAMN04487990_1253 [Bizionia paragorgiae]